MIGGRPPLGKALEPSHLNLEGLRIPTWPTLPLEWRQLSTNQNGVPFPWKVAQTDYENTGAKLEQTEKLQWLDRIFFRAYREVFGEPEGALLWAGIRGKEVIEKASFGDRRQTFAMGDDKPRWPSPSSYAFYGSDPGYTKVPVKDVPTLIALHASAFEPSEYWTLYNLKSAIASFDLAVAGVFIFTASPEPEEEQL